MGISKSQKTVLLITAFGLIAYLINMLLSPPLALYLMWPV
jgi:hypothetical protein